MSTLHIIYITNKESKAIPGKDSFNDNLLSNDNFITGLNKNIWGFIFPSDKYDIKKIQSGDYVLFIKGLRGVSRGKDEKNVTKIEYKQLVIAKVTTSIQYETNPTKVWINEHTSEISYPNRFHFEILGSYPKLQKDINDHYIVSKNFHTLNDTNEARIYTKALLLLMCWVGANAVVKNVKVNLNNIDNFTDINHVLNLDNAILISNSKLKTDNSKISVSKRIRKQEAKETTKFYEDRLKEILDSILKGKNEIPREILARVGQGKFRNDLFEFYDGKCLVTGISIPTMLTASHIKSWSESKDDESCRDPANGILLSANIDRLFDRKLISINPETLLIETCGDPEVQEIMAPYLVTELKFPFTEKNPDMLANTVEYLRYHYNKFIKLRDQNVR